MTRRIARATLVASVGCSFAAFTGITGKTSPASAKTSESHMSSRPSSVASSLSPGGTRGSQANKAEKPLRRARERLVDVLHYRIELGFEESTKTLRGATMIRFRSLRAELQSIEFDAETFQVQRVTDSRNVELAFTHESGILRIDLVSAMEFGEESEVHVDYQAEGMDVDPEAYGMAAGYDLGLDFKSKTDRHPQLINTLSFPEGARHWFPCHDHPGDRATQETLITAPDNYKVLSNGRLVERKPADEPGKTRWHWSQELPHPTYLFVVVAGPYEIIEDRFGDVALNYWVYPDDLADADRSFHKTPEILEFLTREYGFAYPWAKYDQITIPGIGGGAESTSATVLGESTIHDARAEQDFPSHWLIAHEAAHQWWGNVVSYRDWGETWLSESFATYSEYLWSVHDRGVDEGAVNLLAKKDAYLDEARTRYRRPIVSHRWERPNENFDRHTYQKGAAVLNLLRWRLGDEAFRAVLSRFLQDHAFQPVDTHDFMDTIQEVTGRNLDHFFEQWIYSPGHPEFRVSSEYDAGTLRLTVEQVQSREDGTPIYRTPVLLGIHHADQHETHRIDISREKETFTVPVASAPDWVRFDEGNYLIKELIFEKSLDELVAQAREDDVIGRMWAIARLGENGSERALGVLSERSLSDEFWSVRRDAVRALNTRGSLDLLRQAAMDPHSQVRAASLSVMGELAQDGLAGYFRERFDLDDSYVAQAEALRALGKLRRDEDRALFEKAGQMHSPRQLLRRAATEALAELR